MSIGLEEAFHRKRMGMIGSFVADHTHAFSVT